jgi:caffeoyl-CoA O-methyltransferase
MLSGRAGGGVLRLVARLIGARRILEVGTFTGFGTLCMAEALPEDGEIHTLELDAEHLAIARSFFARSEHGSKIYCHLGPALETLLKLEGAFDMAFLDADKVNYHHYYEESLRLLRPGGVVLVDNALWSGRVLAPGDDPSSQAIDALNRLIESDERVDRVLLTVRDGMFLVRKR